MNHSNLAMAMLDHSKQSVETDQSTASTYDDDSSLSYNDEEDQSEMDISDVQLFNRRLGHSDSTRSLNALADALTLQPKERSSLHFPPPARNGRRKEDLVRHSSAADLFADEPAAAAPTPTRIVQTVSATASTPGEVTPTDHVSKLLDTKLDRVPYESLGGYFLQTTPAHISAWNGDLLRAVRSADYEQVKKMHGAGRPLQACNQFSESILHVCVRRGSPEILNYMLKHGGVNPKVRCDYGRTPLHDALWTFDGSDRSLKMVALLLRQCPEMLLITDKRGFTPLDYIPRGQWVACNKFMTRCLPFLAKLKNNGRAVQH